MPGSVEQAQSQLRSLFPGVKVTLSAANTQNGGYAFYGVDGVTAYGLGLASYKGVPLAYVAAESGSYQTLVARQ